MVVKHLGMDQGQKGGRGGVSFKSLLKLIFAGRVKRKMANLVNKGVSLVNRKKSCQVGDKNFVFT